MNGMALLVFLVLLVAVGHACWSMGRDYEAANWPVAHGFDPDCRCRGCDRVREDFGADADEPDPYDWSADPGALGADVVPLRGERRG